MLYGSRSACIDQKVKKVKCQGHTVMKTVTVAWLLVDAVVVVPLLLAWDCTSYDCSGF